jgi:hypothetical protein
MGRAFFGVGATDPSGASPARTAWAWRLTWLSLGGAMVVAAVTGVIVGVLVSSTGVAIAAGVGGFLVVMVVFGVWVIWKEPGPPRPCQ